MKNSAIEWTHHTFNPWIGCTKVSPGCKNCYAAAQDHRWGHDRWGVGKDRERTTIANWRKPVQWNAEAVALKERHRVFCASLADVFDPEVTDVWRIDLFDLVRRTPQLDWLLLTKRPENVRAMITTSIDAFVRSPDATMETVAMLEAWSEGRPPANVWLGTTVEDQQRADERIPALIEVPAAVHFLSCEPLLERIDLSGFFGGPYVGIPGDVVHPNFNAGIDWVIGGGESGGGARPMAPAWAKALRDQCRAASVPFLFKQWGDFNAEGKRVGKKVAGRQLDGVQHDGYPEARP